MFLCFCLHRFCTFNRCFNQNFVKELRAFAEGPIGGNLVVAGLQLFVFVLLIQYLIYCAITVKLIFNYYYYCGMCRETGARGGNQGRRGEENMHMGFGPGTFWV